MSERWPGALPGRTAPCSSPTPADTNGKVLGAGGLERGALLEPCFSEIDDTGSANF